MGRIGVVLGAGGVAGHAYHAGVLTALAAETGWDPRDAEVIAGTSAGSIVAAMLRGGLHPADVSARLLGMPMSPQGEQIAARLGPPRPAPAERAAAGPRWRSPSPRLLARAARRPWDARMGTLLAALAPDGLRPTGHLVEGIRRLHAGGWPERLTLITAVRMDSGARVVFDGGADPDLATAVAASCAIPGYYQPVRIGGVVHVDGGVHSPTNADVLAGERLDLVVVVSPMSIAPSSARPTLDLGTRLYFRALLVAEVARLRARGTPVVVFEPGRAERAAMGLNGMSPRRVPLIVEAASEETARRVARLGDRLAPLG